MAWTVAPGSAPTLVVPRKYGAHRGRCRQVTRLGVRPRSVPGWVQGLVEDAEPGTLAPGTIEAGKNMVPTPAGRMRTRGGSRIMLTLNDDNTEAEIDHVLAIAPFTGIGGIVIGWDLAETDHYAWLVDSDMAFAITDQANSRFPMGAGTNVTTWDGATYGAAPARPNMAEVWEKMFVADATTAIGTRSELVSIDTAGAVLATSFTFSSGGGIPQPYCIEEYNGVLFMAGYGTETGGDLDRPEMLRHSFLGKSPDASDGFDIDAWALIGAKGQRITALRKGRGLLLVAKEDEFYRVSGFGRAYAGFQYQIEQVSDTQGLGITNPKALIFAEGFWWGVSSQGPIRTDGFTVDLLVGPRKPSWRGIDSTVEAWVAYHPERRLVLFGLHPAEAESGRSDTFPWRVWAWDTNRSVWQPDHEYGADLFHASAITATSAEGPSAAPNTPVTSAESTTGYTASWTNGDATAQTEVWEKDPDTGTWSLQSVVAAGTATLALTGKTNHKSYRWRVRHTKNSIKSAWDVEAGTLAQTLIAAPGQVATQSTGGPLVQIVLTQNADGTDVRVERQIDAGGYLEWNTYTSQPAGDFTVFDTSQACGVDLDYRSRSEDSAWSPTTSDYSGVNQVDLTTGCSNEL